MKNVLLFLTLLITLSAFGQVKQRTINFPNKTEYPIKIPAKQHVWVFILAGQSNMAGRAFVESNDTIPNQRILSINNENEIILAKEPMHFYEPKMSGLDCGMAFGLEIVKHIPDSISVMLIPTALGGSSIDKWVNDSIHRKIKLLSNFKDKVEMAKNYGTIKAILWHQGESDALPILIPNYKNKLRLLFKEFRNSVGNESLIILTGGIGIFKDYHSDKKRINQQIKDCAFNDPNTYLINTRNLKNIGDNLHFNSKSQRKIGKRLAEKYLKVVNYRLNLKNEI
jgi:hypothetical protein